MESKKCVMCQKVLEVTHFSIRADRKNQYHSWCKPCRASRNSKWNRDNPLKSLMRAIRQRDPETDLSEEFLKELWDKQQGVCYWYGCQMDFTMGGRSNGLAVSVDRLDINQKYRKQNVVLCCFHANMGRTSMSVEQYKTFLKVLKAALCNN